MKGRRSEDLCLPDFLVLGGVRCGTTSLYHYLKSHPDVFMPPLKEPRFFVHQGREDRPWDTDTATSLEQYSGLFAGATEKAKGEASAIYLYQFEIAVPRIRGLIPDAKLIAVLRDPAERAFSQYRMAVAVGAETLPTFRQALDVEDARVGEGAHPIFHYRRQSFYGSALEAYQKTFGADRLAVYTFEELTRATAATMRSIFRFLGVNADHSPPAERVYFSTRPAPSGWREKWMLRLGLAKDRMVAARNRSERLESVEKKLSVADRAFLTDLCRSDVERTGSLLDRDLSAWLET